MKKVLFVIHSVGLGGSITSLINLIELLNQNNLKTELFIMNHTGVFLEKAREITNVLPENIELASSICNKSELIRRFGLIGLLNRIVIAFRNKLQNPDYVKMTYLQRAAKKIKDYDVVISYQENLTTEFVSFIKCDFKIAWVHTLLSKFSGKIPVQQLYEIYNTYDRIICVSKASLNEFRNKLPKLKEKTHLIGNPININDLIHKSKQPILSNILRDSFNIISVGRLVPEKQFDYAIKVAKRLNDRNYKFNWVIIGDGDHRLTLENLINNLELQDKVLLTGMLLNPFSLIKNADLVVISSQYESQPMVAIESLILGTPVLTTNFPSAKSIINHNINGLICDNNLDGIYNSLESIFDKPEILNNLKKGARKYRYKNEIIILKIIKLCRLE